MLPGRARISESNWFRAIRVSTKKSGIWVVFSSKKMGGNPVLIGRLYKKTQDKKDQPYHRRHVRV